MNNKKDKVLWYVWLNKTHTKELEDAIVNDDSDKASNILNKAFKEGLIERK